MADEEERKIPVLTVTKNGAILKNIFVVKNPPSPPSVSDTQSEKEYGDEDEILTVGRHPDCHIMLTHPSISRFHLQIHSKPSSQKLSVIDLSSVHGTWVSEKKLEPRVPVELNEGDTIRVGGSTRMYRLHWVPLSQAYDMEKPFVSRLDVSIAESKEVADGLLEEEDDFETNQDPNSWSIEMKHTEMEDLLVKERKEEGTYQDDNSMAVKNKAIQSLDSILDGIVSLFSDGNCFLSSGIESVDLSVPVREAISESMEHQFHKDDQVPWHYPMTEAVSDKENPDIFSTSEEQSELLANLFASPSVAEEVKLLEEFKDESLLQEDDEMRDNSKLWSESLMKEPVYPSLALGEVLSEIKTEQVDEENQTLQPLTGLQPLSENENKENLPVHQNLDLLMNLSTACFVEDGCPAAEADQTLSRKDNEEQEIPSFGTDLEAESVNSSLPVGEVFTKFNDDKESQTPQSFYAPAGLYEPENLEEQSELLANLFASPSVAEEVKLLEEFKDESLLQEDDEMRDNSKLWSESLMKEPVYPSLALGEVLSEIKTEQVDEENQTLQPLTGLQPLSENKNKENLPVDQNLDLVVNLKTACLVEDCCSAAEVFEEADQTLSRKDHEEQEIPSFGTVLKAESVNSSLPVGEVFTEFNEDKESQTPQSFFAPAGLYEPENLDSSSTPCFVEDGCPAAEVFEDDDQTLSRKDHEEHEIPSFGTDLEAESVNSSLPVGEVFTEFKERQTQQSFYAPVGLYEPENLDSSTRSDKKPSSNNIWSRRGKPASVLQIQTGRSGGKTIRDQDSAEVEFQDLGDTENKQISRVLFSGLDDMEEEPYTPNKENYSPNTLLLKSFKRKGKLEDIKHSRSNVAFSPNVQLEEEDLSFFSDKENQTPKVLLEQKKPTRHASTNQVKLEQERPAMKKRTERVPFYSLIENSAGKSRSQSLSVANATTSSHSVNYTQPVEKVTNPSSTVGEGRRSWTMIVDAAATLLDKESRKSLQLLQGLKGTQLIIPRMVIRELDCLKRRGGLFRRTTEISSVLEWIEECMVKTEWWIHIQSSAEDLMPIAPTPPASPQSRFSDGSTSWGPFSSYTSLTEIVSPTAEDHILDYGLLYRKMNGGQLVLLSNDVTLKIKAMAEGLICETAQEFRESLVNPFSERFLWAESSPRGLTWSHLDDDVLRERYSRYPLKKKPSKGGDGAKGLKLILLHNSSHYGQIR